MSAAPTTMRGLVPTPKEPLPVQLREGLAVPTPSRGEVLVRVTHATVNGHEFGLAQQPLVRALAFLSRTPGVVRTGLEFAGVVASEGAVFAVGERVMGYSEVVAGGKPHADYVAIPESYIARVPDGLASVDASTLPMSGMTALAAVRDVAELGPGQEVLVLGATGGVGVLAVQLARSLGATVTAYAQRDHHRRLRALGAHRTVDYRQTRIADMTGRFDAVLDFSATLRLRDVRHLLGAHGRFVPADPMANLLDLARSRQARYLYVDRGDTATLDELAARVVGGDLTPVVDRTFAIDDWRGAVERSQARGRLGRTVLAFAPS